MDAGFRFVCAVGLMTTVGLLASEGVAVATVCVCNWVETVGNRDGCGGIGAGCRKGCGAGCTTGCDGITATLAVEVRLKFVGLPVTGPAVLVGLAKRTPMGLAELKVKPSTALKHRSAANFTYCTAVAEGGSAGADFGTDVFAAGCVGVGQTPVAAPVLRLYPCAAE
jgi:hypothetical protein